MSMTFWNPDAEPKKLDEPYWDELSEEWIDHETLEINMANANARDVLDLLGYDSHVDGGKIDPAELAERCRNFLADYPLDPGTPPVESGGKGTGRPRMIDAGLPEGYFQERATQLARLAENSPEGSKILFG